MASTYLEGERALERLGDLTELIFKEAQNKALNEDRKLILDKLMGQMGDAINERDIKKAKELVVVMLVEVLGYENKRAEFVMNNHLNKNAGWD